MHQASYHKSQFNNIDLVEICSDRTFPRHTHDEFGLGYMVNGGQESWSGRGLVEAKAGNWITVNPGEVHDGIGYSGKARHWKMLYIKPEKLAALMECSSDNLEFNAPVINYEPYGPSLVHAIAALYQPVIDNNACEQLLMLTLSQLFGPKTAEPAYNTHSEATELMLEQIMDQWATPLSLEDLANSAGMSRYQALRHFKSQMGITPHCYLTQYRLNRVKSHLEQGKPLVDTAIDCGFADQSHMTRAFKRQFGISPGKLWQQYRKVQNGKAHSRKA